MVLSFGHTSRECPPLQGELVQFDAGTGAVQHIFKAVPDGCVGASIWSSPVVDPADGSIYATTGNAGACSTAETYSVALVKLRASDLTPIASWQGPSGGDPGLDLDFGASPTLVTATIKGATRSLVGVANKGGSYFAFDRNAIGQGPLWTATIPIGGTQPELGDGSISTSAWDGNRLYVAGGKTTVGGAACAGSIRALDPATGAFVWEVCLDGVSPPIKIRDDKKVRTK